MGDGLPVLQLHRPPCAPAAGQRVLEAARPGQRKWRGRPPRPSELLPTRLREATKQEFSQLQRPTSPRRPARTPASAQSPSVGGRPSVATTPFVSAFLALARVCAPLSAFVCGSLAPAHRSLPLPSLPLTAGPRGRGGEGRERSWLRPQEQELPPPPSPARRPRRGSQSGQSWLSGLRAESRAPELILGRA